jgi:hypothetical protein
VLVLMTESARRVDRREAEGLVRSLLRAASSAAGPKDRIYRTGPCELTVLVRNAPSSATDEFVRSLQGEGGPFAGASGIRLRQVTLDLSDAARRLSRLHWSEAERAPAQGSGGLAAAV